LSSAGHQRPLQRRCAAPRWASGSTRPDAALLNVRGGKLTTFHKLAEEAAVLPMHPLDDVPWRRSRLGPFLCVAERAAVEGLAQFTMAAAGQRAGA
jgi:hypothetical protein